MKAKPSKKYATSLMQSINRSAVSKNEINLITVGHISGRPKTEENIGISQRSELCLLKPEKYCPCKVYLLQQ